MRSRLIFGILLVVMLVGGFLAGCASGGGQPRMHAALDELQSARRSLQAATSDKGGHRVRAITLVDEAIAEVQAGIDYARR